MLHAPINKNKTKDNLNKTQSETESLGRDRSSGWASYSSLSLGGENRFAQAKQGNDRSQAWQPMSLSSLSQGGILHRKCACGSSAGAAGTCGECQSKEGMLLQTKLSIGASDDKYEQEADRVADEVISMSPNSVVNSAPPSIQRFTGQTTGQAGMVAPASVDSVLSSPGSPLEYELQQDMGQRFGHDFSHVRVHTDAAAARSAEDVNAHAYTVGHNIVFGSGQFTPGTEEGRRLITHELAHVIQQTPPSLHQPSSTSNPKSGKNANSIAIDINYLPSPILQGSFDSEAENPWNKLSPSVREEAQKLYEECDDSIGILNEAQMVHVSSLRSSWLNFLRRTLSRIEDLDSDSKLAGVKNSYTDFIHNINRIMTKSREEWSAMKKLYLEEHQWLLSSNVKSTDSIEAAKYLDEIYQQIIPSIPFLVTEEDYFSLKNALSKKEYIRVGSLRGARIRARQLKEMMNTVVDLLRKGEDANNFIPDWSDRVSEEAAYLDSFAKLAREAGRDYAVELADLRKQLLERQQETLKVKPQEESVLGKVTDFVEGGIEAIMGIFVEAAKEVVDLVQIDLHFMTNGIYEPQFISDMAAAAEQGASTGDLLKGMVTGIIDTPSRFLKACRDGDWKAIGKESVNLYVLAKTIKEAPQTIKKIPGAMKKLQVLLAKTRESLRILRQRTVALGLKNEGHFITEPLRQPVSEPTPTPIKQGGSQGSGKPTGMLRDTDSASLGAKLDASPTKTPAKPETESKPVKIAKPLTAELPPKPKVPQKSLEQLLQGKRLKEVDVAAYLERAKSAGGINAKALRRFLENATPAETRKLLEILERHDLPFTAQLEEFIRHAPNPDTALLRLEKMLDDDATFGATREVAASEDVPIRSRSASIEDAIKGIEHHARQAVVRRASGKWDLVDEMLVGKDGKPIRVAEKYDKAGNPIASTEYKSTKPDAVSFNRREILDDKPLGNRDPLKYRDQMIGYIRAYEVVAGSRPDRIIIQWYDPITGNLLTPSIYPSTFFLP
jgi:hypothetical protein